MARRLEYLIKRNRRRERYYSTILSLLNDESSRSFDHLPRIRHTPCPVHHRRDSRCRFFKRCTHPQGQTGYIPSVGRAAGKRIRDVDSSFSLRVERRTKACRRHAFVPTLFFPPGCWIEAGWLASASISSNYAAISAAKWR